MAGGEEVRVRQGQVFLTKLRLSGKSRLRAVVAGNRSLTWAQRRSWIVSIFTTATYNGGDTSSCRGRDMRSKKVLVIVAALVACLAIGSATVATAKKKKTKKITTTISLAVAVTPSSPYAPYPPGTGAFSGKVKAKGPSGCRKRRTVTISRGGSR